MPKSKDTVFVLSLRKISCLLHWDTVFVEKCKESIEEGLYILFIMD